MWESGEKRSEASKIDIDEQRIGNGLRPLWHDMSTFTITAKYHN